MNLNIEEEDVVFKESRWGIVDGGHSIFYSRHAGCCGTDRGGVFSTVWMHWTSKTCNNCYETIPDNIQVLVRLLMWGS